MRAGDGAHRGRADAIAAGRILGGLHQFGVIGQSQVIVRAKIEHPLSIHHQPAALGRAQGADAVVEAGIFQAVDFLLDPVNSIGHGLLVLPDNEMFYTKSKLRLNYTWSSIR